MQNSIPRTDCYKSLLRLRRSWPSEIILLISAFWLRCEWNRCGHPVPQTVNSLTTIVKWKSLALSIGCSVQEATNADFMVTKKDLETVAKTANVQPENLVTFEGGARYQLVQEVSLKITTSPIFCLLIWCLRGSWDQEQQEDSTEQR